MRLPSALSFTSLKQHESDPIGFFLDRMCSVVRPRHRQGKPAAAGSGFDAYVKPALSQDVLGKVSPELEFDTLFAAQVDAEQRDFAREAGKHLLQAYRTSGAYDDLRALLEASPLEPRFEFEARREVGGVKLVGRPDCFFGQQEYRCVADWKVRGYCSTASPSRGYLLCRDGFGYQPPSRSHGKAYKGVVPTKLGGMVCSYFGMEGVKQDFAEQLSVYGWLEGLPVGDESFVGGIEELVCTNERAERPTLPKVRVALHRGRIGSAFQRELLERFQACWQAVTSGHVFSHLSRDKSDELVQVLEAAAIARAEQRRDRDAETQLLAIQETYQRSAA